MDINGYVPLLASGLYFDHPWSIPYRHEEKHYIPASKFLLQMASVKETTCYSSGKQDDNIKIDID
jgi:hypothetical protein